MTPKQQLQAMERAVKAALAEGVTACTEVLEAEMERLAPVETGELKSEIHAEKTFVGKDFISGSVAVGDEEDAEKVFSIEFGTEDTPAQPFARPGAAKTEGKRKSILQNAARNALK